MKKISLILLTVVCTLMLFSCDLSSILGTGGQKYDGTVVSVGEKLYIVKGDSAPGYVSVLYNTIAGDMTGLGADVYRISDSTAQSGYEIALGETTRQASKDAYALINAKYKAGNVAYALVYKDGVLALAAKDEYSLGQLKEHLYYNYVTDEGIKVPTDLSFSVNMSAEEYEEYLKKLENDKLLATWDERFDDVAAIIGDEGAAAMKNLYKLFDEDLYMWVANLWDPETGAFYYSASARDYSAFKPDIESTCQALKLIGGSGMLAEYGDEYQAWDAAMPQDMQDKMAAFVLSLYDDSDGYFYHSQWGSNIPDDRRGRDLQWSLQVLDYLNVDMPDGWVPAVDRLKGNKGVKSAVSRLMESEVIATASDGRFESVENFIAYLDRLDILSDPYPKGHQLASQSIEIKAAGLINVCCDYLDALQTEVYETQVANNEKPSGVWSPEVSYNSVSGFFKISVVYSSAGRAQKYLSDVVDTCIECILSDEPTNQIVYVYNPWAAIGEAFSGMLRANKASKNGPVYDMEAEYAKVRSISADLISKTMDKTLEYRQPDMGYSYNTIGSASRIQGVYASLGTAEGDLNGSCLVSTYMLNYMCTALGVEKPALWTPIDFDKFMTEVGKKEPITKIETPSLINEDFQDYSVGERISASAILPDTNAVNTFVAADPKDSSNMVLSMYSPANHADGFRVNASFTNVTDCFTMSFRLNMQSRSSGATHQISIYSGTRMYMMALKGSTDTVRIHEDSSVNGSNNNSISTGISFPVGEWFDLKIELYNTTDTEGNCQFSVKYYVDGQCVYTGSNFYNELGTSDGPVQGNVTQVWFYNLKGPEATLLVDDIYMSYDDKDAPEGDSGSATEKTYDFEDGTEPMSNNFNSRGASGKVASVAGPEGKTGAYRFTKSNTGGWDQLGLAMPSEIDNNSTLVYEMDVKFNELNGNAQLALGGLDYNTAYMLTMSGKNGVISLGDAASVLGSASNPSSFGFDLSTDEWHHIRIEMEVTERANRFEARVYVDGTLVSTSSKFYNYDGTATKPNMTLDFVNMRFVSACTADLYIDNVQIYTE